MFNVDSLDVISEKYRKWFNISRKSSFIDMLAIQKINKIVNKKLEILKCDSGETIYFRDSIPFGFYQISRLSKGHLYYQNSNIPIEWNFVNGEILRYVLYQIEDNNFYVFKKLPLVSGGYCQFAKTYINDKRKIPSPESN